MQVSGANPTCVFWDHDILDWSKTGCEFFEAVKNKVLCRCYHLTNFAVLVVSLSKLENAVDEFNGENRMGHKMLNLVSLRTTRT